MSDPGFWIEGNVIAAEECIGLINALSSKPATGAGARHLMNHPAVAALARDRRLMAIAASVLGSGAEPFRATLFTKSRDTNWLVVWHQDTALPLESRIDSSEWGPWSKKAGILYAHAPTAALSRILALRVHLDASTKQNGPLRVIPGSHARGVLSDQEVFRVAKAGEPVECVVPRGGVLAMRPLLIHASSKAECDAARRVLHIEYAEKLQLDSNVRLAIA